MSLQHRHFRGGRLVREGKDAYRASGAEVEACLHLELLLLQQVQLHEESDGAGRRVEGSVERVHTHDLEAALRQLGAEVRPELRITMGQEDERHVDERRSCAGLA